MEAVWYDGYTRASAPPGVSWSFSACPSKPDDPRTAVVDQDGMCYSGRTYLGWACPSEVAWRGSFGRSAFAHELMHYAQGLDGVHDPDHKRLDDWKLSIEMDARLIGLGL